MQITVTSYRPKKRDFSPKTEEEEGKKTNSDLQVIETLMIILSPQSFYMVKNFLKLLLFFNFSASLFDCLSGYQY